MRVHADVARRNTQNESTRTFQQALSGHDEDQITLADYAIQERCNLDPVPARDHDMPIFVISTGFVARQQKNRKKKEERENTAMVKIKHHYRHADNGPGQFLRSYVINQMRTIGLVQFGYLPPTKERNKEKSAFKKMKSKWQWTGLFFV